MRIGATTRRRRQPPKNLVRPRRLGRRSPSAWRRGWPRRNAGPGPAATGPTSDPVPGPTPAKCPAAARGTSRSSIGTPIPMSSLLGVSTIRSSTPWPAPSLARGQLWVRGEIHHLSDHRSGHLYLELTDPDDNAGRSGPRGRGGVPTLNVKCWRTTWAPLRHALAKEGVELTEGMIVVLRGSLDLYRAKGELSLVLAEIDVTAILGRMAAQRAALLRKLEGEGLLARQRRAGRARRHHAHRTRRQPRDRRLQRLPRPPARIGFRLPGLLRPRLRARDARAGVHPRALRFLSRSDCDVIALVRGGGSRADLAAFETEIVARAVATATKPVFTGIGHTGDETVADVVAARACITPTECGHTIAVSTRQWWSAHVAAPAHTAGSTRAGVPGRRRDARRVGGVAWSRRRDISCARTESAWATRPRRWPDGHRPHSTDAKRRRGRVRRARAAAPGAHLDRSEEQRARYAPPARRLRRGAPTRTRLQPDPAGRRDDRPRRGSRGPRRRARDTLCRRNGAEPGLGQPPGATSWGSAENDGEEEVGEGDAS